MSIESGAMSNRKNGHCLRYRYVVLSLFMVVAASLLVLVAILNVFVWCTPR